MFPSSLCFILFCVFETVSCILVLYEAHYVDENNLNTPTSVTPNT